MFGSSKLSGILSSHATPVYDVHPHNGLRSKWQLLHCRYIIITAKLAALQPGVVLVIHVAFCFGGAFSGAAVSRGFNIETVTAGLEPCN